MGGMFGGDQTGATGGGAAMNAADKQQTYNGAVADQQSAANAGQKSSMAAGQAPTMQSMWSDALKKASPSPLPQPNSEIMQVPQAQQPRPMTMQTPGQLGMMQNPNLQQFQRYPGGY